MTPEKAQQMARRYQDARYLLYKTRVGDLEAKAAAAEDMRCELAHALSRDDIASAQRDFQRRVSEAEADLMADASRRCGND